jgi:hypothetical protein
MRPLLLALGLACGAASALPAFEVSVSAALQRSATAVTRNARGNLDGRLLLLLSDDPSAEPRFQVNLMTRDKENGRTVYGDSQILFGVDVEDVGFGGQGALGLLGREA